MSDLTRRGFFGTTAVAAGAFTVPKIEEAADVSFQNNLPGLHLAK